MKIASWNVNSINVRLPHLLDFLASEQPDVMALQETKAVDEKFPIEQLQQIGYEVCFTGQKTFNGVATLSKTPATDVVMQLPDFQDPQKRFLACTVDGVRIVNVYVPNGQSVDSEKYQYKLSWLSHLNTFLAEQLTHFSKVVVLGDYNIAPEDRDVHDPQAWQGHVLVSPQERAAFQDILALGFSDSFRLFEQDEKLYSWWDYRQGAFRRNRGLRIDHILLNKQAAQACKASWIDKTPRSWERPSDHTVVLVELG